MLFFHKPTTSCPRNLSVLGVSAFSFFLALCACSEPATGVPQEEADRKSSGCKRGQP
jgi:hypothetical protein